MKQFRALIEVLKLTKNKLMAEPKYFALIILALFVLKKVFFRTSPATKIIEATLSEFLEKVDRGQIEKALVKRTKVFFTDKFNSVYQANHSWFPKKELFDRLLKRKVQFENASSGGFDWKRFLLIMVVSAVVSYFLTSMLDLDLHTKIQESKTAVSTFKDVVGLEDSKTALKQVIDFMKDPSSYQELGARMRKGIIFYGPSGTGKTSLAKACSGEAGVPFFSCNAAEFRQMYVGVGAKKVRQLFKKARKCAPSIIYIDEIDAMGNRNNGQSSNYDGAASQKNSTINQLLSEMDGFNSSKMVLVIGSTNKLDLLDSALLRPGRFDLKIKVSLPSEKDRYEIFDHYLQNKKHKLSEKYRKDLMAKLRNWSGADLQNLANQSVYVALRRKSQQIDEQDVQNALKVLH